MTAVTTIAGGPFPAGSTLVYSGQLLDGAGAGIPAADLDSLSLTASIFATGAVVGDIYRADVLNSGRGAVDAEGNYQITLGPADTNVLVGAPLGTQTVMALVIDWTFNNGLVTGRHQANVTLVALTEANLP